MGLMNLVQRGVSKAPLRIVLYGVEGIGKTTWAHGAPDNVFIGNDAGHGDLDVTRLPTVTSWPEVFDYVDMLIRDEHTFRTVVLDTIDGLEKLCHAWICEQDQVENIETVGGGYGKGYTIAAAEHRRLADRLDVLREKRGVMIIVLAHSHVKPFTNPDGANYDRYQLQMNEKAAAVWKAWADCLLFANYDVNVKTRARSAEKALLEKGKGMDGERKVYTERSAAYDAKNRHNLPEELPMLWGAFARAVKLDERMKPPAAPETWDDVAGAWAAELGKVGLRLDEDVVPFLAMGGREPVAHPSELKPEYRRKILAHVVKKADEIRTWAANRRQLQVAFSKAWDALYPTPVLREGASKEERDAAVAKSDADRAVVLQAWYGVDSRKAFTGAHAAGERGLRWFEHLDEAVFAAEVTKTLAAAAGEAA
jgi:hypothetical protein